MFKELKRMFTIRPVLVVPDLDKEIRDRCIRACNRRSIIDKV